MANEKFFTIDGLITGEIVEKKSRFIAQISHVESEDEALAFIADVKKEHIQARHNVYAYIVGAQSSATQRIRFTDDGEPSQTAGKPTLETLQHANLCNVACVVTRYFGGTLLGTGGLVRAYSGAVKTAIENAQAQGIYHECIEFEEKIESCSYSDFEQLKRSIQQQNGTIVDVNYAEVVTVQYKVPKA